MKQNKDFLMIIRPSKPSKIMSKMFNSISLLFKKTIPYLFNMKNFETNLNIDLGQILSFPFLSLAPDQYLTTTFKEKNFFYD